MKNIQYYTAGWCQPCKVLAPLMQELSNSYPIEKIDIDENKEMQRKNNVMGVPTVIIFEDGKEKQRLVGLKTKQDYVRAFEQNI